jgi:hypothetical protein
MRLLVRASALLLIISFGHLAYPAYGAPRLDRERAARLVRDCAMAIYRSPGILNAKASFYFGEFSLWLPSRDAKPHVLRLLGTGGIRLGGQRFVEDSSGGWLVVSASPPPAWTQWRVGAPGPLFSWYLEPHLFVNGSQSVFSYASNVSVRVTGIAPGAAPGRVVVHYLIKGIPNDVHRAITAWAQVGRIVLVHNPHIFNRFLTEREGQKEALLFDDGWRVSPCIGPNRSLPRR